MKWENLFDYFQCSLMTQKYFTSGDQRETFFNPKKCVYIKSLENIIINGRIQWAFLLMTKAHNRCLPHCNSSIWSHRESTCEKARDRANVFLSLNNIQQGNRAHENKRYSKNKILHLLTYIFVSNVFFFMNKKTPQKLKTILKHINGKGISNYIYVHVVKSL